VKNTTFVNTWFHDKGFSVPRPVARCVRGFRQKPYQHNSALTPLPPPLVPSAASRKSAHEGEQKMTVQHVHVAEGGQAIVGNVSASPEG
jgi:hypothetical protein